ncbi:hypothetical protein HOV93_03560 [Planctomycetes bacterium FF15]|uniref:Uncharacterized protein n=1 Tax=Bremerella alba TaxID=980252 RepID=A0A7V9A5I2_9BACT|nr:hypothetical protein [Bremerella alba]
MRIGKIKQKRYGSYLLDCPPCRLHFEALWGAHVKNGFRPRCLHLKRKSSLKVKNLLGTGSRARISEGPSGMVKRASLFQASHGLDLKGRKPPKIARDINERHWVALSWNSHLLRNILGEKCFDMLVTISSYQWFEAWVKYFQKRFLHVVIDGENLSRGCWIFLRQGPSKAIIAALKGLGSALGLQSLCKE